MNERDIYMHMRLNSSICNLEDYLSETILPKKIAESYEELLDFSYGLYSNGAVPRLCKKELEGGRVLFGDSEESFNLLYSRGNQHASPSMRLTLASHYSPENQLILLGRYVDFNEKTKHIDVGSASVFMSGPLEETKMDNGLLICPVSEMGKTVLEAIAYNHKGIRNYIRTSFDDKSRKEDLKRYEESLSKQVLDYAA